MPTVKLPFFSDVYQNVDGTELTDEAEEHIDCYRDEVGHMVRRPGLQEFLDLGEGSARVDGLFWWPHKGYGIAVCNGKTFKLTYSAGTLSATNITGSSLALGTRVIFTTDGTYVFMANGGKITYSDGTTATAYIADADAPVSVTHVEYLDNYIMANTLGSFRFYWSGVASPFSWSALDFASAVGDADYITAMLAYNRELYLLGPESTEIWENDGTTPFSRIPGGMIQSGIAAPYSVVQNENEIYWLDKFRHFVSFNGRQVKRQASSYDKTVQAYNTFQDCTADRIEIDGKPFFVFNFPTEDKTLVLNYEQQSWSRWGYWNTGTASYNRWLGNCYMYAPDWNLHLVGARNSSKIYAMSPEYHTDAGNPIRMLKRTGHLDFNESKQKRLDEIRFRVKRGEGNASNPQMMIRWRDNNRANWSNEHQIPLGNYGNSDLIARMHRLGIFRARQFEIVITDAVSANFGTAEADIMVLR